MQAKQHQHKNGNNHTGQTHAQDHNGLAREHITDIQRARMLTAMAEACAEHGAANTTVAHVVERAGVSRRTFYEIFNDIEDCLTSAIEDALGRASLWVLPAYASSQRWLDRMRAGLAALLQFLDEQPALGRLLIVETLAAGPAVLERRSRVLAHLVTAVDEGRRESKAGSAAQSRLTAEGVVGAVLSVLHGRMLDREGGSLRELAGPLASMVALPYLGAGAARRELQRRSSPIERRKARDGNALKQLQMRLTYRTVRVLAAVDANPGASNRAIGDASDIGDQGQISKLLARLERLGLIENGAMQVARGDPNAWRLTELGKEVRGALAAQSGA